MVKGCSIYRGFNLNKELLKLYSTNLSQDDLLELKRILARFFAQKAINEADRIWEEKGLSNIDMKKWLNE
ncbi:MAG TPA: hypothetical protein VK186_15860 [Candidatus Deferrimicrobium sp.]|nr:hypothetical protein [Candidatus Kapabacteria bacterium]HLP60316.1 hypothetical protein [Candidatus Deferrimicrobium sp.]